MERLTTLYRICLQGNATPAETGELRRLLTDPENAELAAGLMREAFTTQKATLEDISPDAAAAVLQAIFNAENRPIPYSPPVVHRVHFLKTAWFRYAAAVLLLVATGAYFWSRNNREQLMVSAHRQTAPDIAPGKAGAILTLADGRQVVLDSLGNGAIATQNGSRVLLKDGRLAYDPTDDRTGETMYNTMTTPRGRQYQLTLPDGTKVWLNAASSITYPTAFNGRERKVSVTGEAYFEVGKDKTRPFRVSVNNQSEVEVLGTHFNVDGYEDDGKIKITLLEGSVRVGALTIRPGQQAVYSLDTRQTQATSAIDIDQIMAWKNGLFYFDNADIKTILNQLSRWYDVELVYEHGLPDIELGGEMKRDLTLSQVLKGMGEVGVNFKIEGKKLIVTP